METTTVETPKVNIDNLMAQWARDAEKKQKEALKSLKELTPKFVKEGLNAIFIHYSGCGDSGEVTEIYGTYPDSNKYTNLKPERLKVESNKSRYFNYKDSDYEKLSDITYDLLTYDWYNNEGGNGTIQIDLNENTIDIDAYYVVEQLATPEEQKDHLKF